jgi:hypothetical protein
MVKSIITLLIALSLLIGGAFYEQHLVKRDFELFEEILTELYEKIEKQECNKDDALSVQKWWIKKKESLHIYIPHNDIKEIDYWLAECVSLVYTNDYNDALSKVEVLLEICEHIPDTYNLKIENIL